MNVLTVVRNSLGMAGNASQHVNTHLALPNPGVYLAQITVTIKTPYKW